MLGYRTVLQEVVSWDFMGEWAEACQEVLSKVDAQRLHPHLECLEYGNNQSFLGRDRPRVRDRHRVGEMLQEPLAQSTIPH